MTPLQANDLNLGIPKHTYDGATFSQPAVPGFAERQNEIASLLLRHVQEIISELQWMPFYLFPKTKRMAMVKFSPRFRFK